MPKDYFLLPELAACNYCSKYEHFGSVYKCGEDLISVDKAKVGCNDWEHNGKTISLRVQYFHSKLEGSILKSVQFRDKEEFNSEGAHTSFEKQNEKKRQDLINHTVNNKRDFGKPVFKDSISKKSKNFFED